MSIDNIPLFTAMNQEEVKPCFPHPHRPMTSQEAHFVIMEKVNACISEVNKFEDRVRMELEKFMQASNTENFAFKEAIQSSYNAFMVTIQKEVNNFETSMNNNYSIFSDDIDKRIADFQSAINNEFTTLQENVIKASNDKIEELTQFQIDLNSAFNEYKASVNAIVNSFKQHVNTRLDMQDSKIEDYKEYMVDNILQNTEYIFNQKANNGEITKIVQDAYGESRTFKGSLSYDEIHAISDANNGDYYYCTTDEHYYQKTETTWVDIGLGDNTLNNLVAFQTLATGRFNVGEQTERAFLLGLDIDSKANTEPIELTMVEYHYINKHGDSVPYKTLNVRHSEPVPVTSGDILYVNGLNWTLDEEGATNPICAFYDANGSMVKSVYYTSEGLEHASVVVVVPYGASTICINDLPEKNSVASLERISKFFFKDVNGGRYTESSINNILWLHNSSNFVYGEPIEFAYTSSLAISYVGDLINVDGTYAISSNIQVEEGAIYKVRTLMGYTYRRWEVLDKNFNVIKYQTSNSQLEICDDIFVMPRGAKYIRISSRYINESESCHIQKLIAFESSEIKGKWHGKVWACMGDSLTESNSRTLRNYHNYIAEETGITVNNLGLSGSGFARRQDENFAFYQRVSAIAENSDVITIMSSGNDLSAGLELGTPSDTDTDTLCGCVNATIDAIITKNPKAQLGIITTVPWSPYPPNTENTMKAYNDAIIEICKGRSIPYLDLYRCSNLRPWTEEGRAACYTRDDGGGCHPDENGHKIIAPRIRAFLESLVL